MTANIRQQRLRELDKQYIDTCNAAFDKLTLERNKLRVDSTRTYGIGNEAFHVQVDENAITLLDQNGAFCCSINVLTPHEIRAVADIVRVWNDWCEGKIDEMPPSGEWHHKEQ